MEPLPATAVGVTVVRSCEIPLLIPLSNSGVQYIDEEIVRLQDPASVAGGVRYLSPLGKLVDLIPDGVDRLLGPARRCVLALKVTLGVCKGSGGQ